MGWGHDGCSLHHKSSWLAQGHCRWVILIWASTTWLNHELALYATIPWWIKSWTMNVTKIYTLLIEIWKILQFVSLHANRNYVYKILTLLRPTTPLCYHFLQNLETCGALYCQALWWRQNKHSWSPSLLATLNNLWVNPQIYCSLRISEESELIFNTGEADPNDEITSLKSDHIFRTSSWMERKSAVEM